MTISTYENVLPEDGLPDLAMMKDLTQAEVAKLLKHYLNAQNEYVPSVDRYQRHWECNPTKGIDLFNAKLFPIRNCSHLLLTVVPNVRKIETVISEGISFFFEREIWNSYRQEFLSKGTFVSSNLPSTFLDEKRIQRVVVHIKEQKLCAIIEIYSKDSTLAFTDLFLNFDSYASL